MFREKELLLWSSSDAGIADDSEFMSYSDFDLFSSLETLSDDAKRDSDNGNALN